MGGGQSGVGFQRRHVAVRAVAKPSLAFDRAVDDQVHLGRLRGDIIFPNDASMWRDGADFLGQRGAGFHRAITENDLADFRDFGQREGDSAGRTAGAEDHDAQAFEGFDKGSFLSGLR